MLLGGVYFYPEGTTAPEGKLRLLYECNPIAFITEQAGGKSTDGHKRILEIKPKALHERVPFYCGNRALVEKAEEFLKQYES